MDAAGCLCSLSVVTWWLLLSVTPHLLTPFSLPLRPLAGTETEGYVLWMLLDGIAITLWWLMMLLLGGLIVGEVTWLVRKGGGGRRGVCGATQSTMLRDSYRLFDFTHLRAPIPCLLRAFSSYASIGLFSEQLIQRVLEIAAE